MATIPASIYWWALVGLVVLSLSLALVLLFQLAGRICISAAILLATR